VTLEEIAERLAACSTVQDKVEFVVDMVSLERERCANLPCPPARIEPIQGIKPRITDEVVRGYNQAWKDYAAAIRSGEDSQ